MSRKIAWSGGKGDFSKKKIARTLIIYPIRKEIKITSVGGYLIMT